MLSVNVPNFQVRNFYTYLAPPLQLTLLKYLPSGIEFWALKTSYSANFGAKDLKIGSDSGAPCALHAPRV